MLCTYKFWHDWCWGRDASSHNSLGKDLNGCNASMHPEKWSTSSQMTQWLDRTIMNYSILFLDFVLWRLTWYWKMTSLRGSVLDWNKFDSVWAPFRVSGAFISIHAMNVCSDWFYLLLFLHYIVTIQFANVYFVPISLPVLGISCPSGCLSSRQPRPSGSLIPDTLGDQRPSWRKSSFRSWNAIRIWSWSTWSQNGKEEVPVFNAKKRMSCWCSCRILIELGLSEGYRTWSCFSGVVSLRTWSIDYILEPDFASVA